MDTNNTPQGVRESSTQEDRLVRRFCVRLRHHENIALLDLWSSVIFIPSIVMLIGAAYGLITWPETFSELRLVSLSTIFFFLPLALMTFGLFKRWQWARKVAIFVTSLGILNWLVAIIGIIWTHTQLEPTQELPFKFDLTAIFISLGLAIYFFSGLLLLLNSSVLVHFNKNRS